VAKIVDDNYGTGVAVAKSKIENYLSAADMRAVQEQEVGPFDLSHKVAERPVGQELAKTDANRTEGCVCDPDRRALARIQAATNVVDPSAIVLDRKY
jgi:hypothetical protein